MRIDTTNIKRLIRNASLATIAVVGLSALMPSTAEATVRVRVAPVKTTVVVRPAKPVLDKYVWVSGHYVKKPGCRRLWIKGHWKRIG